MATTAKKPNIRSKVQSAKGPVMRTRQPAKQTAAAAPLVLNVGLGPRTEYRIYPSIGIARVGDSKDGFLTGLRLLASYRPDLFVERTRG